MQSPQSDRVVAEIARGSANRFYEMAFAWGKIISVLGEDAGGFRKELVGLLGAEELHLASFRTRSFHPFTLRLPDESNLLVPIANGILGLSRDGIPHIWTREDIEGQIPGLLTTFAPMIASLEAIVDDGRLRDDVRVAAILLGILHPSGLGFVSRYSKILMSFAERSAGRLAVALSAAASLRNLEHEPQMRRLLSDLYDLCRSDVVAMLALEPILDIWRRRAGPDAPRDLATAWIKH